MPQPPGQGSPRLPAPRRGNEPFLSLYRTSKASKPWHCSNVKKTQQNNNRQAKKTSKTEEK